MATGRRTAAVVVSSLILAPAGTLVLGHYRRTLSSFAAEVVALGVLAAGALRNAPWILAVGILLGLLNRVATIRAAIKLPPEKQLPGTGRVVWMVLALLIAEHSMAQLTRGYVVEAFKIPSGSMIPTLRIGDHVFVDKRATTPRRGDVIIFRSAREPQRDFIKRVIAVGGDTVSWDGEAPTINGRPIARRAVDGECKYFDYDEYATRWEPRACREFEETLDGRSWRVLQNSVASEQTWKPVVVPPGAYYVVGDNRDNSHDSRYLGAVAAEDVKGTAVGIWWSADFQGAHTERMGLSLK